MICAGNDYCFTVSNSGFVFFFCFIMNSGYILLHVQNISPPYATRLSSQRFRMLFMLGIMGCMLTLSLDNPIWCWNPLLPQSFPHPLKHTPLTCTTGGDPHRALLWMKLGSLSHDQCQNQWRTGCWEMHNISTSSDPNLHGSCHKSTNPYTLRNCIIPN